VSGWLEFDGQIETLGMGRSVYTILRLPGEVAAELDAAGAARVEAEIAEHPASLALRRIAGVEGTFLWTGRSLIDRIGAAPGTEVPVRLRPADAEAVETPADIAAALGAAGALAAWEALTPGARRGRIHGVETARRAETRAARIAKLAAELAEGAPAPARRRTRA
jgi:hypothetical protein